MLRQLLAHPLTRGLDIDDPRTTHLRQVIIGRKSFLRKLYREWYETIVRQLPPIEGPVLELGSGGGFLRDFIPGLITSEVFPTPGVSAVLDAHALPFADASLRAIVMTNVLHHLARPRRFFTAAARSVKEGGAIVMIEPWVSTWSKLIYPKLHYEPFDPHAPEWEFPDNGPLSGANNALPWIVFIRDRAQFEREFPVWHIQTVRPMMPFRYLLSGGVSMRSLMPGWSFTLWRGLENCLGPWMSAWGMFALIVLTRRGSHAVVGGPGGAARGNRLCGSAVLHESTGNPRTW